MKGRKRRSNILHPSLVVNSDSTEPLPPIVYCLNVQNGKGTLGTKGHLTRYAGENRQIWIDAGTQFESMHHNRCIHSLEQRYEKRRAKRRGSSATQTLPYHNHPRTDAATWAVNLLWWRCKLVAHADPEAEVAALAEQMHYEHSFEIDIELIHFKALMAKADSHVTGTEKKTNFEICNQQQAHLLEQKLRTGEFGPITVGKSVICLK